jgi:DNA polymerase
VSPSTAADLIPPDATLDELRRVAAGCTACDLHETGTQTVFGDGPSNARFALVGEQPGDREDQEGRPFVGPAGRELDRGLDAVGLGDMPHLRTNVVKHFKWQERRGKRRIHQTPNQIEIDACLPWLRAELATIPARVVVALGATAAKVLVGRDARVQRDRGRLYAGLEDTWLTLSVHPSSVLRSRDDEERHAARAAFHDDLAVLAALVQEGPEGAAALQTRDRLRQQASELEIRGRSRMAKDELAAAIVAHLRDHAEED